MPNLPQTGWTIVSQRETLGLDGNGKPVDGMEIAFQLGDKGQFTVFVPRSQYSPANVQAAVAAYAAQITGAHNLSG